MRKAWRIAGALAVVALGTLGVREYNRWAHTRAELKAQHDAIIAELLEQLRVDDRARKNETRAAVERAAGLVEYGVRRAEAYYALGLLRTNQDRYGEALAAYERAAFLRPDWSLPHIGRGIALHLLDRDAEAIQAFETAIKLDPADPRAHDDLAILYRLLGRFEDAEREAKLALQLGPDEISSHNNYGNLLFAQGIFDKAEAAYRRAIEIDPTHPTPYYNLACTRARQGDAAAALDYLRQAFERDAAFKLEAVLDPDLKSLHDLPEFQALVNVEPLIP